MPKKIEANFGTLFDLKAEYYRKKGEQTDKPTATKTHPAVITKPLPKPRKDESKEKQMRQERIKVLAHDLAEEERNLQKSRQQLEQKAKMYERLTNEPSSACDDHDIEDPNNRFLVNFAQKRSERRDSSDDDDSNDKDVPSDEEFVEFTGWFTSKRHSLGRTRRCMRKDLSKYQDADRSLIKRRDEEYEPGTSHTPKTHNPAPGPTKDVFYQHVASDDARELGAGYYKFDVDSEKRAEQMQELQRLRDQTKSQREKYQQVKSKRQQLMAERLAKVAKRRKLGEIDVSAILGVEEEPEAPDPSSIPLPEETSAKAPSPKPAAKQREWDVGKEQMMLSQSEWIQKNRAERNNEFAPPSSYFK